MNYYNPYFYSMPNIQQSPIKTGLFSKLFGKTNITFNGIINGTQRVLSFANQAIPFIKQVKPIVGNAKTMLKVMNEFKRTERNNKKYSNQSSYNSTKEQTYKQELNSSGPTFFM